MTTQQDFLRSAMDELNLTPDEFSHRLNCERRTLDRWLDLYHSKEFVMMNDSIWALLREILEYERSRLEI
jgi:hypothetical protein